MQGVGYAPFSRSIVCQLPSSQTNPASAQLTVLDAHTQAALQERFSILTEALEKGEPLEQLPPFPRIDVPYPIVVIAHGKSLMSEAEITCTHSQFSSSDKFINLNEFEDFFPEVFFLSDADKTLAIPADDEREIARNIMAARPSMPSYRPHNGQNSLLPNHNLAQDYIPRPTYVYNNTVAGKLGRLLGIARGGQLSEQEAAGATTEFRDTLHNEVFQSLQNEQAKTREGNFHLSTDDEANPVATFYMQTGRTDLMTLMRMFRTLNIRFTDWRLFCCRTLPKTTSCWTEKKDALYQRIGKVESKNCEINSEKMRERRAKDDRYISRQRASVHGIYKTLKAIRADANSTPEEKYHISTLFITAEKTLADLEKRALSKECIEEIHRALIDISNSLLPNPYARSLALERELEQVHNDLSDIREIFNNNDLETLEDTSLLDEKAELEETEKLLISQLQETSDQIMTANFKQEELENLLESEIAARSLHTAP